MNPDTSDHTSAAQGKVLRSVEWFRDAGGFVETLNFEVPADYTAATPILGVLESKLENERNIGKSRAVVRKAVGAFAPVVDSATTESEIAKRFTCGTTITTTMGAVGQSADTGLSVISSTVKAINGANSVKVTETGSYTSRITQSVDDDGNVIKVTESIHAAGTAIPASTADTWYKQEDLSCTKLLRTKFEYTTNRPQYGAECDPETCLEVLTSVERLSIADTESDTLGDLTCEAGVEQVIVPHGVGKKLVKKELKEWDTWEQTIYVTGKWSHPTVLLNTGITLFHWADLQAGSESFAFKVNPRWGFTTETQMKIVETLVAEPVATVPEVTNPPFLQVIPTDLYHDGILFQLQLQNVLHDVNNGLTFKAETGSVNLQFGAGFVDAYQPHPSTPSATEYNAIVASGLWYCVSDTTEKWKYCLFKRRRVYIKPL